LGWWSWCLRSKSEALISGPNTAKKKKGIEIYHLHHFLRCAVVQSLFTLL
jgi:hypothetical protein